jgi:hypothetical protein
MALCAEALASTRHERTHRENTILVSVIEFSFIEKTTEFVGRKAARSSVLRQVYRQGRATHWQLLLKVIALPVEIPANEIYARDNHDASD